MRQTAATRRIGEVLVQEGILPEAAVRRALGFQKTSGEKMRLGSILLNWDLLDENALLTALAKLHRCPAVPWAVLTAAPIDSVLLLSAAQAFRLGAVPYASQRGLIRVAFANPSNIAAIDETASLTGRRVAPAVSSEVRLLQAHRKFYGRQVPLEYRALLQKLDRRPPVAGASKDSRLSDRVPSERSAGETPSAGRDAVSAAREISIAPGGTPTDVFEIRNMTALERPSSASTGIFGGPPSAILPAPVAVPPQQQPQARLAARKPFEGAAESSALSEDSLSEWVGEALAAFTGEASDPAVQPLEFDSADPDSPAGVADPVLFGRSAAQAVDPRDDFADPAPLRFESSFASDPSSIAEQHRRGVPDAIPPFRRAGDPGVPLSSAPPAGSRFVPPRDEDAVVAGMWRPAPDDAAAHDPDWNSQGESASGDSRRRDEIADSVLRDSLSSLPRAILLGAGRTGVVGWRGRGRGLTPESVAAIRVPHSEISVFSAVQESGVPHFAVTERSEWPRALADLFGPKPLDCAIFPIRVFDDVAAFVYADRNGEPMHYEDFALIARAAASAASVLSRFLLPRGSRVGS